MNLATTLALAALIVPAAATAQGYGGAMAQAHAAKNAWENCIMAHTRQMSGGQDSKALERQVGDACRPQYDAWMHTVGASPGSPEYNDLVKSMPDAVHLYVVMALKGGPGAR